ncbi:MAG TPA: phosphoribosylglycinamide formyltransferase [Chloroflexota bacterium]|nr:phosphoribosylglycinamide formyltransferase [Chloroflexota bacterium]
MKPLPIGVLISGQGTNLDAILRRCESCTLDAEVRLVVSNRANAPGLEYGRRRHIPTTAIVRSEFDSREAQQREMARRLIEHGVELVVLAGFDQILSAEFVETFRHRLINLHPSLLPAFGGGMHAVRDALDYGVKVTGATVHLVDSDFPDADSGPIILQAAVPVLEGDDEASLLARIHEVEHQILPEAIQLFAEGRIRFVGRKAHILEPSPT